MLLFLDADTMKQRWKGIFQGVLIVQTLAAHETAIKGSRWVAGMYEGASAPKPRAALAVATIAVRSS